ncbi:MAG: F0F1 ATP synthase subunit alpha, partial [Rhodospirillaceae bacterium]|nr:F0F1 ATP synthase subunit alpha [Rhodospirillaceae bacterium]
TPLAVEEQVCIIFAGVKGYLDKFKASDVSRFEHAYIGEIRSKGGDILEAIRSEKAISEETEAKMHSLLEGFVKSFT